MPRHGLQSRCAGRAARPDRNIVPDPARRHGTGSPGGRAARSSGERGRHWDGRERSRSSAGCGFSRQGPGRARPHTAPASASGPTVRRQAASGAGSARVAVRPRTFPTLAAIRYSCRWPAIRRRARPCCVRRRAGRRACARRAGAFPAPSVPAGSRRGAARRSGWPGSRDAIDRGGADLHRRAAGPCRTGCQSHFIDRSS